MNNKAKDEGTAPEVADARRHTNQRETEPVQRHQTPHNKKGNNKPNTASTTVVHHTTNANVQARSHQGATEKATRTIAELNTA